MNIGIIAKILGFLTLGLCALGLLPLIVSLTSADSRGPWPWLIMIGASSLVAGGLLFAAAKHMATNSIREGMPSPRLCG